MVLESLLSEPWILQQDSAPARASIAGLPIQSKLSIIEFRVDWIIDWMPKVFIDWIIIDGLSSIIDIYLFFLNELE